MDGLEGIFAAIEVAQKRKMQAAAARRPATFQPQPQPPPAPPAAAPTSVRRAVPPGAASKPAPPAPMHSEPSPAKTGPLQAMFEDGNSLLKAIVASEVLGPPAALREHHLWNQSPNEPST